VGEGAIGRHASANSFDHQPEPRRPYWKSRR
jgi:hypothetical protein